MSLSIREVLIGEAEKYLGYEEKEFKRYLSVYESVVTILSCVYEYSVIDKELEPIENLPEEEKRRFWIEAKKLKPGADQDSLIKVSKALYLKSKL